MSDNTRAAAIQHDTLELTKTLIACRSVTPADGGALDLIGVRLTHAGFTCEHFDRGGVRNLWARWGHGRPLICLAGHVDVVPPGPVERWTSPPFVPTERDGYLYGRGAADMKTSVAAMVTAAERVARTPHDGRGAVALLLTSDEEGEAVDGTAAVVGILKQRGDRIDACILGEPTSSERFGDMLKNGRRGSVNGTLRVGGIQSHIAYPERGRNPIHAALPALTELASTVWDQGNEYFQPTRLQISNVQAGTGATNVVPGELVVMFNIRFSSEWTASRLHARVIQILDRHSIDYGLEWNVAGDPFITPKGRLSEVVTRAVAHIANTTPTLSTSGGTSDGRFLSAIATELIEFGPINESIHKVDERIAIADIGPLSSIYEQVILALLEKPS